MLLCSGGFVGETNVFDLFKFACPLTFLDVLRTGMRLPPSHFVHLRDGRVGVLDIRDSRLYRKMNAKVYERVARIVRETRFKGFPLFLSHEKGFCLVDFV